MHSSSYLQLPCLSTFFPASYLSLPEHNDLAAHKIVGKYQASHFLASQLLLPKIDDTKLPLSCTVDAASCFDSARHTDVIIYSQSLRNIYLFAIWLCAQSSDHLGGSWARIWHRPSFAQHPL
jgi:hypothetical protein